MGSLGPKTKMPRRCISTPRRGSQRSPAMVDPGHHSTGFAAQLEPIFRPTSDNRSGVWRRLASLAYPFRELVVVAIEERFAATASIFNGALPCSQFESGLVVLG
jgi:hypothetical protein